MFWSTRVKFDDLNARLDRQLNNLQELRGVIQSNYANLSSQLVLLANAIDGLTNTVNLLTGGGAPKVKVVEGLEQRLKQLSAQMDAQIGGLTDSPVVVPPELKDRVKT